MRHGDEEFGVLPIWLSDLLCPVFLPMIPFLPFQIATYILSIEIYDLLFNFDFTEGLQLRDYHESQKKH